VDGDTGPFVVVEAHAAATSMLLSAVLEFEVIDHVDTPLGVVMLRRRNPPEDHVLELALEHQLLMSSVATVSERALATRAIAMHGGTGLDVMIGGLGLGYTAQAALESDRVARVEVVELIAGVIAWFERGVIPLGPELMADPRFVTVQDDVYDRLGRAPIKRHDLLLIDVDHSPDSHLGESSDTFYGAARLTLAKQHLEPHGIFGVWSTSESPWFEDELHEAFDEVHVEPISFFNETAQRPETNWLFLAR
jgi:spermidine synthase